jgi:hypothetical protein
MPLSFMLPKGAISPAGFRRDDAFVDADDALFEGSGEAPGGADVGLAQHQGPRQTLSHERAYSGQRASSRKALI